MQTQDLSRFEAASAAVLGGGAPRFATDVAIYLTHIEGGVSIRRIAGDKGRHPSTILRTVRRVEAMRDDPLIEHALSSVELAAGSHR